MIVCFFLSFIFVRYRCSVFSLFSHPIPSHPISASNYTESVNVTVHLTIDFNSITDVVAFQTLFVSELATALGISTSRILIRDISQGGVNVIAEILPAPNTAPNEPTPLTL